MKKINQTFKLVILFSMGILTMQSCSTTSTDDGAATTSQDTVAVEVAPVEEITEEPVATDLDWASDLKMWIMSGEGMKSITLDKISGEGELSTEAAAQLDLVAAILESNPTIKGEIQGHSSNKGKPAQEKVGSAARAEWTRLKLIFGRDAIAKNITAKGYGSERPIEGMDPADERQKRITIELTK